MTISSITGKIGSAAAQTCSCIGSAASVVWSQAAKVANIAAQALKTVAQSAVNVAGFVKEGAATAFSAAKAHPPIAAALLALTAATAGAAYVFRDRLFSV
ncbi:MAG: hypothetical protein FJZ64_01980 [Chlamydiae bacterium]|nr:hypothetical protein [Chlamydiota bacterium]